MQNGKGDKWRKTNYKQFFNNFDDIDWGYVNCDECGMPIKSSEKHQKMIYENGAWKCKRCNFN